MGDIPADLIVLAFAALFLILRLRNTLGKQIGLDPRERESRDALRRSLNAEAARRAEAPEGMKDITPDPAFDDMAPGQVKDTLKAIAAAEPGFSTTRFLDGAKAAYEWVFNAFHKGDRATLKPLLSAETFAEFDREIQTRTEAGQQSQATLVALHAPTITEATLTGRTARITVRLPNEQILLVRDRDGAIVEGDASLVHHTEDEWVFERELGARSPNWIVVAT